MQNPSNLVIGPELLKVATELGRDLQQFLTNHHIRRVLHGSKSKAAMA